MFPVPNNFGALWCTTWQICCKNNLNDLGYMKYITIEKWTKSLINRNLTGTCVKRQAKCTCMIWRRSIQ